MRIEKFILIVAVIVLALSCTERSKSTSISEMESDNEPKVTNSPPLNIKTPEGMVWVPGKTFLQGAKSTDIHAMPDERPSHKVAVDGFFIDKHEVTNRQFMEFVRSSDYVTVAERPINWNDLTNILPPNTVKPNDSLLQAGSLVFNRNLDSLNNSMDHSQWWTWRLGANWRRPYGPESSIKGLEDFPVIHIAYLDALNYCKWAGRRLPTEAEWELAAQGKGNDRIYTWGNDKKDIHLKTNVWQGRFPVSNDTMDGYVNIAPIMSFRPNDNHIYDMLGNVWEWTNDKYNSSYYSQLNDDIVINPQGAKDFKNALNPNESQRIIKGGSYLCADSYCANYRISARMGMAEDSSTDHLGFRTVLSLDMINVD